MLNILRKYMKICSGRRTRCKFVPGWSVCISIRNSVSNGMLYVEDDIRIVESERSHCRRAMVWEGHVTFVKYKIMLMVNYRSVHSRLSAHAVYTPPPNRRRCPGCVRHQILGILCFSGPISPLLFPSCSWFCILAGLCLCVLYLFPVMLPAYLGNARHWASVNLILTKMIIYKGEHIHALLQNFACGDFWNK